eukprot:341863-Pleurochrysis_carterae.AAC.2
MIIPGLAVARRRLATKALPSSKLLLETHHSFMLLRLRWTIGSAALAVAASKTAYLKVVFFSSCSNRRGPGARSS